MTACCGDCTVRGRAQQRTSAGTARQKQGSRAEENRRTYQGCCCHWGDRQEGEPGMPHHDSLLWGQHSQGARLHCLLWGLHSQGARLHCLLRGLHSHRARAAEVRRQPQGTKEQQSSDPSQRLQAAALALTRGGTGGRACTACCGACTVRGREQWRSGGSHRAPKGSKAVTPRNACKQQHLPGGAQRGAPALPAAGPAQSQSTSSGGQAAKGSKTVTHRNACQCKQQYQQPGNCQSHGATHHHLLLHLHLILALLIPAANGVVLYGSGSDTHGSGGWVVSWTAGRGGDGG